MFGMNGAMLLKTKAKLHVMLDALSHGYRIQLIHAQNS